jgi:hypothetical protein
MVKNDSAQCQVNVPCGLLGVGGGGSYLIHPNPHGGEGVSVASSMGRLLASKSVGLCLLSPDSK